MNKLKTALLWGSILTLLTGSGLSLAQGYRGDGQDNYYQNPQTQGSYYSQHYRPGTLQVISVKVKSPVDLLEESINKVIRFLSRPQRANLEQITFFLNKEITPHFDFQYMARWVAGRYYRTMSPEQQRKFTKNFAELFTTTFVQKLSKYQVYPPVIENFRSRRTSDDEAMATATVIQENGGSIQVDFKFIKTPRGWKVVDVRANGVSALFYYRNFFAEQARRQKQNQSTFK